MKVLKIWHGAVNDWYRDKIRVLNNIDGLYMGLLIPPQWTEGGYLNHFEVKENDSFPIYVGKIRNRELIHRYFFYTGIVSALRKFKPDIIDLEEEPYSYVAWQTLQLKKIFARKAKILFNSGNTVNHKMNWEYNFFRNQIYKNCPAAFARGKGVQKYLEETGYNGKIFITGNGISLERFKPAKNKLFIPDQTLRIIFIGRLVEPKGIQYLLEALSQIKKDWKLTVIGQGPYKTELKKIIKKYDLNNKVKFKGNITMEKIPNAFLNSDLLVLPSYKTRNWSEVFGRVIIEANACGVPAIASKSGGMPQVLNNKDCLFPEKDSKAITALINKIGWNKRILSDLSKKALENAKRYSWEKLSEGYHKAYKYLYEKVL